MSTSSPRNSRPRAHRNNRSARSSRAGSAATSRRSREVKAQIATAQAQVKVSQAQVDTTRAQLETARWELTQTTVRAPGNGTMVNVMLRPGFFVAGMPFNEVMTFVDNEYQIFALFGQNELHQVEPGQRGRDRARHLPGPDHQGARGLGDLGAGAGTVRGVRRPSAHDDLVTPPGRFPVKLLVAEHDKSLFLAAGARGAAAIYTDHLRSGAHHPQGAAARGVVSQLRDHQAQHQPRSLGSGTSDGCSVIVRSPARGLAARDVPRPRP